MYYRKYLYSRLLRSCIPSSFYIQYIEQRATFQQSALQSFYRYRVAKTHGCLKLLVIFRERATNYRALLRKMTCRDEPLRNSQLYSLFTGTGWRRVIGCLKLQVIFGKRATMYGALSRKMTCRDKVSYDSTPPFMGWL